MTIATGAVTSAKLGASAVGETKLATDAVTTAKIADEAVTLAKLEHGTSSNDGKFLRANNGADPSYEAIPISARNLIINGAMQVAHRGNISSVQNDYGGADRFSFRSSGAVVVTLRQQGV